MSRAMPPCIRWCRWCGQSCGQMPGWRISLLRCFPCGSITGAPKIRSMEILAELEPWARDIYCGTIGWAAPDGASEFNVAIRTLMLKTAGRRSTWVAAWSGTAPQSPNMRKRYGKPAFAQRDAVQNDPAFRLIETLGWHPGRGFRTREGHLARMARSAGALGLPFQPPRRRADAGRGRRAQHRCAAA